MTQGNDSEELFLDFMKNEVFTELRFHSMKKHLPINKNHLLEFIDLLNFKYK